MPKKQETSQKKKHFLEQKRPPKHTKAHKLNLAVQQRSSFCWIKKSGLTRKHPVLLRASDDHLYLTNGEPSEAFGGFFTSSGGCLVIQKQTVGPKKKWEPTDLSVSPSFPFTHAANRALDAFSTTLHGFSLLGLAFSELGIPRKHISALQAGYKPAILAASQPSL